MMAPSSAIAFDLDDTLYPESMYVLSGFKAVARWAEDKLDIPQQEGYRALSDLFHAGVRGDTFNRWLKKANRSENRWLQAMIKIYREHEPVLHPYDDVFPCLSELQAANALGIITEGVRGVQEKKLKALELPISFASVIITDISEREHWKPSTVPFERFQSEVKIPVVETWYIGDNPHKDFRGARELGILTVRIRRGDGLHRNEEPREQADEPDFEIQSLSQLSQLIQSRNLEV